MTENELITRYNKYKRSARLVKLNTKINPDSGSYYGGNWDHPLIPKCRMGCGNKETPLLRLKTKGNKSILITMCRSKNCLEECFSASYMHVSNKSIIDNALSKDSTLKTIGITDGPIADYPSTTEIMFSEDLDYDDISENILKHIKKMHVTPNASIKIGGYPSWQQNVSHYSKGRNGKSFGCKDNKNLELLAEFRIPGLERIGVLSIIKCNTCGNQFTAFDCT